MSKAYRGAYKFVEEEENTEPQDEPQPEPKPGTDNWEKRYGDLRRLFAKETEKFKAETEELRRQVGDLTRSAFKLPKNEEDLKQFYADFPDGAAFIETIASMKAKELFSDYEEKIQGLEEARRMTAKEKAYAQLLKLQPDFEEIKGDPAFRKWLEEQPASIQASLLRNDTDAFSAARSIDLYKADLEKAKRARPSGRKRVEEAASSVSSSVRPGEPSLDDNGKKIWRESEIQARKGNFTDAEEADMTSAMREGRLIRDLSAAR